MLLTALQEEEEEEDEWEYNNYAHSKEGGLDHYMVAGGGMMNGNAYAEVVVDNSTNIVRYVEHGNNAFTNKYSDSKLMWCEELNPDKEPYKFNIVPM